MLVAIREDNTIIPNLDKKMNTIMIEKSQFNSYLAILQKSLFRKNSLFRNMLRHVLKSLAFSVA